MVYYIIVGVTGFIAIVAIALCAKFKNWRKTQDAQEEEINPRYNTYSTHYEDYYYTPSQIQEKNADYGADYPEVSATYIVENNDVYSSFYIINFKVHCVIIF